MREKIKEYIKQLEKSYEQNESFRYHPINVNTSMFDYYQGKSDSIRATINDLNDILNNRTYSERLDELFVDEEDEVYARKCSECGKEMTQGYCIDGGIEYYCSDECLHKHYTEEEWLDMYEDGGDSYWTEWEEDEEDEERLDLIYEYETKIAKAKRNNDTESQYYYQDKLDELLRENDMNNLFINKKEE